MNASRSKVKTGCRTCKKRKVKCDESRPSCQRCVSTGRPCAGYGVWGGGSDSSPVQESLDRKRPKKPITANQTTTLSHKDSPLQPSPTSLPLMRLRGDECGYYEWFALRTSVKLPGTYRCRFWNTLVFQTSAAESAIMHGLLALSSVHKAGTLRENTPSCPTDDTKEQQFALQHYSLAIRHLQPHLSAKNKTSYRVALVACLVFVVLELMQGNFQTARVHLSGGLKIIRDVFSNNNEGTISSSRRQGRVCRPVSHDGADEWILEAFSRFDLQLMLLSPEHQDDCDSFRPIDILQTSGIKSPSFNDLWNELSAIILRTFRLSLECRRQQAHPGQQLSQAVRSRLHRQQVLGADLGRWRRRQEESEKMVLAKPPSPSNSDLAKMHRVIRAYGIAVEIMVATSTSPDDETVFDSQTAKFVELMELLPLLWDIGDNHLRPVGAAGKEKRADLARSVVDLGWMPLLYYTALKCRVHRLRVLAVAILGCTSHLEGFWDSAVAVHVARKVIEIEAGTCELLHPGGNDALACGSRRNQGGEKDSKPNVPRERRIGDVEICFINQPQTHILVRYVQQGDRVHGGKGNGHEYRLVIDNIR